jgi:YHS domain-containing protein
MKKIKLISFSALLAVALAALSLRAGEEPPKVKPYPLTTCAVCGMKLGDMGKPYVFEYQGREIKVCEKPEEATFKKDPAKYLKKVDEAEAKAKASEKK